MAREIHEQILEGIKKSKNTLITFRKNYSLDSVVSAIGLYFILKKMGKLADIVSTDFSMPDAWKFLPQADIVSNIAELRQLIVSLDIKEAGLDQFSYNVEKGKLNIFISPKIGVFQNENLSTSFSRYKYDLIIILDTPDLDSLGRIFQNNTDFFLHTPVINIDHNPANEEFGHIRYIDPTAISTSEILYDLFEKMEKNYIDEDVAQCLLAGMIYETKSFKTGNVTPKSLNNAKSLIELGADRQLIIQHLYRSQNISTLRLWGKVLSRMKTDESEKLVWASISENDFTESQASPKNLVGLTEEIITSLPRAEVAVFIYRIKGIVNVRVEVFNSHNAIRMTKKYSPAGDKSLAEFIIPDSTLLDAETEVINTIREYIIKS